MSQHRFFTDDSDGRPIEVLMGWDQPMQGFFLVIERPDGALLYSNLDDRVLDKWHGLPRSLDHFFRKLRQLRIKVPKRMIDEVLLDERRNAGNRICLHQADGFAERSDVSERFGPVDRKQHFPARLTIIEDSRSDEAPGVSEFIEGLNDHHDFPADEFDAQEGNGPPVWPEGPVPGVYVTHEQKSIDALMAAYEQATGSAVLYAERAGSHWPGSTDLQAVDGGIGGVVASAPAGTLFVLGPFDLNEPCDEAAWRLEIACTLAQVYEHRFAVLLRTTAPDTVLRDARLLVQARALEDSDEDDNDDTHEALVGVVAPTGHLESCNTSDPHRPWSFVRTWPFLGRRKDFRVNE